MPEFDSPRWSLALLQTKITPPRPPLFAVNRPQLLARLSDALNLALTVVIAPAGFGKTTLLAQWCDAEIRIDRHVVGWLSLDHDDDDPQQLGAYVLASLCRAPGGVGQLAEKLMRNDPLTPDKLIMSMLLNEIADCGRQVFLVIDDFDRPSSEPCRALLSRLLRYAPENFHVLLGLRSDPHLGLAKFDTQRRLLRLGAQDLRFSPEDSRTFFAQASNLALDHRSVQLLHDATEGWVAGLQLASLSLSTADDAPRVAGKLAAPGFGVDAYFDDVVLPRLPTEMNDFLLRTSILDRLSPGVCDALMGAGARSWEKLDWLERHHVFIAALDEDRQWFRYHALMTNLLRRRAERQLAGELQAMHSRASRWFAAEFLWLEAARHALAAGEFEQASLWVERGAASLVNLGDARTLLSWIGTLPPGLVDGRPRLRLAKAWALTLSFRTREATVEVEGLACDLQAQADANNDRAQTPADATLPTELTAVKAFIAVMADDSVESLRLGNMVAASPALPPLWARRFAEAAQVYGLAHEGRFDEIRGTWSLVEQQSEGSDPLLFADVYRVGIYGMSLVMKGRLRDATELFQTILARAEQKVGRSSVAAALPAGYLASLYYELNDLVGAQQMVTDRTPVAMEGCALGSLLRYCRTAARLYARQGDFGSALVILDQARELATARHWLRLRAGCDAEAVRLYLAAGRIAQARQTADELRALMPERLPSPMGSFLETWCYMSTIEARIAMADGRAEAAVALLDAVVSKLAAVGMGYMAAASSLLLAIALEQQGAQAEALATLRRTLSDACSVGMISSFVDEGERLLTLLHILRRGSYDPNIPGRFIDKLLTAFESRTEPPSTRPAGASSVLNAREVEILDHVALGFSNKEIARALNVSPETIKWHLKNIFGKLHVSSRVKAVRTGLGIQILTPPSEGPAPLRTH